MKAPTRITVGGKELCPTLPLRARGLATYVGALLVLVAASFQTLSPSKLDFFVYVVMTALGSVLLSCWAEDKQLAFLVGLLLPFVSFEPAPYDILVGIALVLRWIGPRMLRWLVMPKKPRLELDDWLLLFFGIANVLSWLIAEGIFFFLGVTLYLMLSFAVFKYSVIHAVKGLVAGYVAGAIVELSLVTLWRLLGDPLSSVVMYGNLRMEGTFKDPNVFGAFYLPLLIGGVAVATEHSATQTRSKNYHVIGVALAFVAGYGVWSSYSRGAAVSAVVGILSLAALRGWQKGWLHSIRIAGLGALIVAVALWIHGGVLWAQQTELLKHTAQDLTQVLRQLALKDTEESRTVPIDQVPVDQAEGEATSAAVHTGNLDENSNLGQQPAVPPGRYDEIKKPDAALKDTQEPTTVLIDQVPLDQAEGEATSAAVHTGNLDESSNLGQQPAVPPGRYDEIKKPDASAPDASPLRTAGEVTGGGTKEPPAGHPTPVPATEILATVSSEVSQRAGLKPYDSIRFRVQREALALAPTHPFGVGPGKVMQVLEYDTHNLYITALVENGWLGFLGLVGWMFVLSARLFGKSRGQGWILEPAVLLSIVVSIATDSLVINSIHWRHLWLVFAVVAHFINQVGEAGLGTSKT